MTPGWFGEWINRREHAAHEPLRLARVAIGVYYAKPAIAARWLRDVFGFEPAAPIPETDTDGDHSWIEFHIGNSALILFNQPGVVAEHVPVTHTPWVFVDDLDAHFAPPENVVPTSSGTSGSTALAPTRSPISKGITGPSPKPAR